MSHIHRWRAEDPTTSVVKMVCVTCGQKEWFASPLLWLADGARKVYVVPHFPQRYWVDQFTGEVLLTERKVGTEWQKV